MTTRILQIIDWRESYDATSRMRLVAAALGRVGYDIRVVALCDARDEISALPDNLYVSVIQRRWALDPRAFWRLKNLIAECRPALVHCWGNSASGFGRAAALAAGVSKLVVSETEGEPAWPLSLFERRLDERTDALVMPINAALEPLAARGIARPKLRRISAGAEPNPANPAARRALLDELDLPDATRLMGTLGPLLPHKRIKDLIWAADLLKVFRDDVHLLVIGDGPHRWRLERFRDQVRIADKVHFLGERDDARAILAGLDGYWLGSKHELLSQPLVEAIAAGLPVVASDIPANRQLVTPGENGYLVPPGDRAGLARWAGKILDNPEIATNFSAAARAKASESFSAAAMFDGYRGLYEELLGAIPRVHAPLATKSAV